MNQLPSAFRCVPTTEILQHLGTAKAGLSRDGASQRLTRYGSNLLKPQKRSDVLTLLLAQFKSPLILILLFATGLSFFLHDPVNALIILTIVLVLFEKDLGVFAQGVRKRRTTFANTLKAEESTRDLRKLIWCSIDNGSRNSAHRAKIGRRTQKRRDSNASVSGCTNRNPTICHFSHLRNHLSFRRKIAQISAPLGAWNLLSISVRDFAHGTDQGWFAL